MLCSRREQVQFGMGGVIEASQGVDLVGQSDMVQKGRA